MKARQYTYSKEEQFLSASGKEKKEDWLEIIGILLALLVIAAFITIAFTMAIPMAKGAEDMVRSKVGLSKFHRC